VTEPADHRQATAPHPPDGDARNRDVLARHFREHEGRFTREALSASAREAGYPADEVDAAWRLADEEARSPGTVDAGRYRSTARLILLALYLGAFLVLVVPQRMSEFGPYGRDPITAGVPLFLTLLLGLFWVGRRRRVPANAALALTAMLAAPFVLLVIVAGLCLWSTTPPGEPLLFSGGA
jgi:hypothetical protein